MASLNFAAYDELEDQVEDLEEQKSKTDQAAGGQVLDPLSLPVAKSRMSKKTSPIRMDLNANINQLIAQVNPLTQREIQDLTPPATNVVFNPALEQNNNNVGNESLKVQNGRQSTATGELILGPEPLVTGPAVPKHPLRPSDWSSSAGGFRSYGCIDTVLVWWTTKSSKDQFFWIAVTSLIVLNVSLFISILCSSRSSSASVRVSGPRRGVNLLNESLAVGTEQDYCLTRGCIAAADAILDNQDTDWEPCDNFYAHACGAYTDLSKFSEAKLGKGIYSGIYGSAGGGSAQHEMYGTNMQRIVRALEEPINGDLEIDPQWVRKLKTYYQSCVDMEAIRQRGDIPLQDLIGRLGGWPTLEAVLRKSHGESKLVSTWSQEKIFKWETSMVKMIKSGLGGPFFDIFYYKPDQVDDDGRSAADDEEGYITMTSWAGGFLNETAFIENFDSLYLLISTMLGGSLNIADMDLKELNALMDIKENYYNLNFDSSSMPNTDYSSRFSLSQLAALTPNIDWQYILEELFKDTKHDSSVFPDLRIEDINYIRALDHLVTNVTARTVGNYFAFQAALETIPTLGDKRWEPIQDKYLTKRFFVTTTQTGSHRSKLNAITFPRWQECYFQLRKLSDGMSALFVRKHFADSVRQDVERMFEILRAELIRMISAEEFHLFDSETKEVAIKKLNLLKLELAQKGALNESTLNDIYRELDFREGKFFENSLSLKAWINEDRRRTAKSHTVRLGEESIISYAHHKENKLILPAGLFQDTFYDPERPAYLNYGAVGSHIALQLVNTVLDERGRHFDGGLSGIRTDWWSGETADRWFESQKKCLSDQRQNSRRLPSFVKDGTLSHHYLRSRSVIRKRASVQLAFSAFSAALQSLKAERGADLTSQKLPGLPGYSPDQLFFLSFANIQCTQHVDVSVDKSYGGSGYGGSDYNPTEALQNRIWATLSGSMQFVNAFQCSNSSNMALQIKCDLYD